MTEKEKKEQNRKIHTLSKMYNKCLKGVKNIQQKKVKKM